MIKKGFFCILLTLAQQIIAQDIGILPVDPQATETQPLRVAVSIFQPPYVYKASKNQFYGFDISMMSYICKKLNRSCQFTAMPFKNIINQVANGAFDVGVSGITITTNRAKRVRFSNPYLPSTCQFMVHSDFTQPYALSTLQNNAIGYIQGSMFPEVLNNLGAKDSLVGYADERKLIFALHQKNIQIVIADKPTIDYWIVKGSRHFKLFGKPFQYGLGNAIVINPNQPELINQINTALDEYLKSETYRKNVQHFIDNDLSIHS